MEANDNIFPTLPSVAHHSEEHLFPPVSDSSELTVVCDRDDFSASLIARAVEDADAHLLNMNVTSAEVGLYRMAVDLRINHRDAGAVIRSLERYGLHVTNLISGEDSFTEYARKGVNDFLAQLEI
ncbi:MAG: hypothetical protein K2M94_04260 [Paramuribaculum sp.]|nr:hypothetical protein [Paramuribaculum sp.]